MVKASKTDPFRKGCFVHIGKGRFPLCALQAVLAYLARRGNSGGPLFLFQDGWPLTRAVLTARLREILAGAGVPGNFSSHSFRIGAATVAARNGIPDHLIQALGRWPIVHSQSFRVLDLTVFSSRCWLGWLMILVWAGRLTIAVRPKITLKSSWWSLFILRCLFALDSPGIHADWSSPVSLGSSRFVLAGLVMPGYSSFHQAGSAWPLSSPVPTAGGSFMLPLRSEELLRTLPLVSPCPPVFISGLLRLLS